MTSNVKLQIKFIKKKSERILSFAPNTVYLGWLHFFSILFFQEKIPNWNLYSFTRVKDTTSAFVDTVLAAELREYQTDLGVQEHLIEK